MDIAQFRRLSQHVEAILARQIFFIVGFEESGGELLQRMLDAHPAIRCIRDGNYIDRVARPMEQLINPYNQSIKQLANHSDSKQTDRHVPLGEDACHAAILFTALLSAPGGLSDNVRYFGDYSAPNIQHMKALKALFPRAKFIHIIRDGRDVLVSHLKQHPMTEDAAECSAESMAGILAAKWQDRIARAQLFARDHTADYCELRYEDLVMYPQEELLRILLFLGLMPDLEQIEHCVSVANPATASGNPLIDISNGHIVAFTRTSIANNWMNDLPEASIDTFQHFAGTMLLSLGYSEK